MKNSIGIRSVLLAGGVFALAASAAQAAPDYRLLTTIAVPKTAENLQPGGAMTAFDISFADTTGYYYLADRSNAAVDIINGATNILVAQPGGFAGQAATTSESGPDGVLVTHVGGQATLWAGDYPSRVLSFNVNNPTAPVLTGFSPTSTNGSFRADEMAFSPSTNQVIVANNADTPAFATLIDATSGAVTHGQITIPNSPLDGGMEQPVWNPNTGTFFVSVPAFKGANNPGGVQEISATGVPLRTYDFSSMGISSCSPTGLALGGSGNLMVGCGNANTQTVVLNPAGSGTIVAKITGVSGSDEIWYDPATGDFYVTGKDASGHRVIAVLNDAVYALLQSIDLTALGANVNAHSVAVDPLNRNIFVPLEGSTKAGTDSLCPLGCVAVFAISEPAPLPLLAFALLGLAMAGLWIRQETPRT